MPLTIALLSGEPSGDAIAAEFAKAVLRLAPDTNLFGMGGAKSREEGVELLHDVAEWAAIGYVEALRVYPHLRFRVLPSMLESISKRRPSAVVLVDFGAFNVKVARWCSARGVPVLWYVPPGSWRREGPVHAEMARITSAIATPFPWSAERLASVGANVRFVGHPLLDMCCPLLDKQAFAARYGLSLAHPVVGLLPGSRSFEVRHNTPAMLGAAWRIARELPGAQFLVAAASPTVRSTIEEMIREGYREGGPADAGFAERGSRGRLVTPEGVTLDPGDLAALVGRPSRSGEPGAAFAILEGMTCDVIAHSDSLIVCSGTATLEAAILGTPMTVIYRGSKLMELEYKLRRVNRIPWIALPNVLAGRRIVPERIQDQATPAQLCADVSEVLRNPERRAKMKEELSALRAHLGTPGASERTARMALELAGHPAARQVEAPA